MGIFDTLFKSKERGEEKERTLGMSEEERKSYELWVKKGKIKVITVDILGLIGFLFLYGILLWYSYDRAGKSGWKLFMPIIFFRVLAEEIGSNNIGYTFLLIGLGIYVYAWVSLRRTVKSYQHIYEQKLKKNEEGEPEAKEIPKPMFTKETKMTTQETVGFSIRFDAYFVDGIILLVIQFLTGFIVNLLAAIAGFNISDTGYWLMGILIVATYFTYFFGTTGQTYGKKWKKLKVVSADGGPMNYRKGFLRYVGYLICVITLGIGFLWIIWDKNKQGFHDKIAGTYVVRVG